ncbi:PH domain-containing protein [Actinospongicola halichondriae]|uniref:PH domain-containing protein n=1 Tax=Actinospongicola halichondriae TaxID=3236844 RepID=UPI003D5B4BC8
MRPDDTPDLTEPRRTSPLGAVLAVLGVEQLRPLLPVVLVAASSGRFVLVLGGALALGLVYNTLAWWRRTWSYADGVLRLDEGILVRNERRIPVERIQHLELEQRLRHQLFGLSVVRIETAGGSGAEIQLDAIATRDAEALRSSVARPDTAEPGAPVVEAEVLIRLPPTRLLLAGITGPEVAAVLAALAVTFDVLTDLGVDPGAFDRVDATILTAALAVVIGVPLWFLVAGMIGVVRRWDLTATIRGNDLRVTYGLLRRAEFAVDLARVQDVRVAHRLLLRPFGRADLRVRTAASGGGEHSRVDIPLLDTDEVARILARIVPAAVPLPQLTPAPPAARRRALVRGTLVGVALGGIASVPAWALVGANAIGIAVAATGAGLVWGESAYRGLGVGTSGHGTVVHSRRGAGTRDHSMVPVHRVQSTGVQASWFQRRRDLASVRLDLAGAHVVVPDRISSDAVALAGASLPG